MFALFRLHYVARNMHPRGNNPADAAVRALSEFDARNQVVQPRFDPPIQVPEIPPVAPSEPRRPGVTPVSLLLVLLLVYVIIKVQIVVVLVTMALLFATVIERPVSELEKKRIPRGLCILIVYAVILGTIVLGGILLAPTIAREVDIFRRDGPGQLAELQQSWRNSNLALLNGAGADGLGRVIKAIDNPPSLPQQTTVDLITGIVGGIAGAISVFVMAFYYLLEKQWIRRLAILQIHPSARERVNRVWDDVEAQVGRWMRGQIVLCLVIGVVSTIGYGLMGVRFWPILGVIAGITEAIPIAGPWLGGALAVTIALTDSWQKALIAAAFVAVLQACENWILVPRVMRGAVGLTPLTVFLAILAGSQFMSVLGAFLAIPVAAVVQVIVGDYFKARRAANRIPPRQDIGWRWMREQVQREIFDEDDEKHAEEAPRAMEQTAPSHRNRWVSSALTKVGPRETKPAEEESPADKEGGFTPAPK